jgi:hypothetical protein
VAQGANKVTRHFARAAAIVTVLFLCIVYPFLPGAYDILAQPISTLAQVFGALGLLLVPVGVAWLVDEVRNQERRKHNPSVDSRRYYFALASIVISSLVVLALGVVALGTVGISLAAVLLALWVYVLWRLVPTLKRIKNAEENQFSPAPFYLISIPIAVLLFQLLVAAPLTLSSRNRAIANSSEFIGHIEQYRAQHGRYPKSLLAQWKDYDPDMVGIEKYHYSPHEDSYNLFFEQPKFFFDKFGTREWVVYNPSDDHRIYSHTAWFLLLSPEELDRSQGWYEVHDTSHPHWKYFWFD